MQKEKFYYRITGSADFSRSVKDCFENESFFIPLRKDFYSGKSFVFCSEHKKWEEAACLQRHSAVSFCGNKIKGVPLEFPFFKDVKSGKALYFPERHRKWNQVSDGEKIFSTVPADFTEERVFDNYSESLSERDSGYEKLVSETNSLDESCVLKNIAGYRIFSDDEKYTLSIEYLFAEGFSENGKVIFSEKKISLEFNLKNGGVKFEKPEGLRLPESSRIRGEKELKELVSKWAGRSITVNSTEESFNSLKDITRFPYEPLLNKAMRLTKLNPLEDKNRLFLKIRRSPDSFGKFLKILKVKPYRKIRKLFPVKPEIIFICRAIVDYSGFKDVNSLYQLLKKEDAYEFLNGGNGLWFFCRKCNKARSEKSTLNILSKTLLWDSEVTDLFSMFKDYYRQIPGGIKKKILLEGYSEYNHNLLSKIASQAKKKKVKFKYSKKQLSLRDSINGYDFKLPEDSDRLISIGTALSNCAASYTERILSNGCTVVYAVKNNEYKLCIEIRENEVHQQRTAHNNDPAGEDAQVMDEYRERHNLTFKGNRF